MDSTQSFPTPTPQPRPALPKVIPASFTGEMRDYFRIYYMNLFLSVITVGVYSAWATVRNRRFLYGHTSFLGFAFDFDARPWPILISRLIVFALFAGALNVARDWFDFVLILALLVPLLVVLGRSFKLRHSLWRGVRFSYAKRLWPSYAHILCFTVPQLYALGVTADFLYVNVDNLLDRLHAFYKQDEFFGAESSIWFYASVAHLVFLSPIGIWWRHRISASQMGFGKLEFRHAASLDAYAEIHIRHLLVFVVLPFALSLISNVIIAIPATYEYQAHVKWIVVFLWATSAYALGVSYAAHTASVFWNGIATTEASKLQASFKPLDYALRITIPNHLILVASLGLLLPYARMRRWRYLAAHVAFKPSDKLREAAANTDDMEAAIALASAANAINETGAPATDSSESEDAPHSLAPPAPPPSSALPKVIPATFTGKMRDYFNLYYTNLFLGIVTLGVYTAWAKVRNRRFFYGQTSFLGFAFDFDARPLTILISRVIVIAIIIGLGLIEKTWELTLGKYGFAGLTLLLLFPLLFVRGRSFNLRHSLWRGVRFSYAKRFGPSYALLFCFTIPQLSAVVVFTLFFASAPHFDLAFRKEIDLFGEWIYFLFLALMAHLVLLWPVAVWWRHRIRASQMSFGKLRFRYVASIKAYAGTYAIHLLICVLLALSLMLLFLHNNYTTIYLDRFLILFNSRSYFLWPIGLYALIVSYVAHTAFVFWNGIATTEGSKVQATFKPLAYAFWITVPNHVIIVASLGLLLPYARMRRWRYLAAHIAFLPSDSLREAAAGADDVETAIASEAVDLEGFDLDLGMI